MQTLRKNPSFEDLVAAYYKKTNVYLPRRPYLKTLNTFPIQSIIGNHEALTNAAETEAENKLKQISINKVAREYGLDSATLGEAHRRRVDDGEDDDFEMDDKIDEEDEDDGDDMDEGGPPPPPAGNDSGCS